VPPVRQGNQGSAADGPSLSWDASSEVQGNGGAGVGRRGVLMSAAASTMLFFAVEDSKGEIQHSRGEPGSSSGLQGGHACIEFLCF
jgi:hypothetical protein